MLRTDLLKDGCLENSSFMRWT